MILDVDLAELVETRAYGPDDEDGGFSADDVRVEAALVEFEEGLSRDGLAEAFGWPLERVERALALLEERLRPTSRRLRPIGWHRYRTPIAMTRQGGR
jgi:chromosome segregation and condensation protein ScpB